MRSVITGIIIFLSLIALTPVNAKKTTHHTVHHRAKKHTGNSGKYAKPAATLDVSQLEGYNQYPPRVKELINDALSLAEKRLVYKFGSDDPSNHGLDCSGAISYLLKQRNIDDTPRQANGLYQWAWEKGDFYAVNSHHLNSFEFSELKPGDLLFWSGTYAVKHDPAVSHVMLYLGQDKQHRPLMFGATDRRTSLGKATYGVGVFDFKMPNGRTSMRFLGYGCIPQVSCEA